MRRGAPTKGITRCLDLDRYFACGSGFQRFVSEQHEGSSPTKHTPPKLAQPEQGFRSLSNGNRKLKPESHRGTMRMKEVSERIEGQDESRHEASSSRRYFDSRTNAAAFGVSSSRAGLTLPSQVSP